MSDIVYGNHENWYYITNSLSLVACEIIVLSLCRNLYKHNYYSKVFKDSINKDKSKEFFAKSFTFVIGVLSVFILASIGDKVAPHISELFLNTTDANYFPNIFLSPILAFGMALLFRITPAVYIDILALCNSVSLIFFKLACTFDGCCYGVSWDGKFYNQRMGEYQFPVQMVELACAVAMFAILVLLITNKKMFGKLTPLFMLMYCGSRFVSEFWRGDYPAVVGKLTGYHIQCIIGFGLGLLYMIIAILFGKKINAYIQRRNEAFVERMREKLPDWKKNHANLWMIIKSQVAGTVASGFEIMAHMLLVDIILYYYKYMWVDNALLNSIGIKSVGYFWSFTISTAVSYTLGFILGRKFVFGTESNTTRSMIKFIIMAVFTIFVSGWIGAALTSFAQSINFVGTIEDVIVKLISMCIPFIWTYPLNKYVIHRDKVFSNAK